jgi:hypothetical protein
MTPEAGLTDPTTPVHPSAAPAPPPPPGAPRDAFDDRESCPACAAPMATDQRYCVGCGQRREDASLPLVEAATSTGSPDARGGAGRIPPPPSPRQGGPQGRPSPNAVLIAGVATLILAVGLGFLIGRGIHGDGASASHGAQTITIENGSAVPTPGSPAVPQAPESAPKHGRGDGRQPHLSPRDTPEIEKIPERNSGPNEQEELEKKTQEQLHAKVPLAKPTVKPGESCEEGTAGCGKDHKFHGVFFGEE